MNMLLLGLVTVHLYNPSQVGAGYKGQVGEDGTVIYNPIVGYRQEFRPRPHMYLTRSVFGGLNSVHSPMVGGALSAGVHSDQHHIGFIHGFYLQDNNKFRERDIEPFSAMEFGSVGIVPVVGIEHQYEFKRDWYSNAVVSPLLINLGLGWRF